MSGRAVGKDCRARGRRCCRKSRMRAQRSRRGVGGGGGLIWSRLQPGRPCYGAAPDDTAVLCALPVVVSSHVAVVLYHVVAALCRRLATFLSLRRPRLAPPWHHLVQFPFQALSIHPPPSLAAAEPRTRPWLLLHLRPREGADVVAGPRPWNISGQMTLRRSCAPILSTSPVSPSRRLYHPTYRR
ncbi:hypothetical protein FKP32DRAFT_1593121 [Trametes sanguinea]|nr:hypothetical protein FKP32DRAFT_1593121 [Trametes sanguinea]